LFSDILNFVNFNQKLLSEKLKLCTLISNAMDKLKLEGQNLVFKFRHGRVFAPCTYFIVDKRPNLKWKTWLKQLFGYLPLTLTFLQ